jgi:hypothetical protein
MSYVNNEINPSAHDWAFDWASPRCGIKGIVRLRKFEYCPRKVPAKLKLVCPHCGSALDPKLIKRMAGKIVGSIRGSVKARPSAVARAAVMKRWAKRAQS